MNAIHRPEIKLALSRVLWELLGEQNGRNPIDGVVWREKLVFEVESRSEPTHPHLVDLSCYRFNGKCDCKCFELTLEKRLREGAEPSDKRRCWHIRKAYLWLNAAMVPILSDLFHDHDEPPVRRTKW